MCNLHVHDILLILYICPNLFFDGKKNLSEKSCDTVPSKRLPFVYGDPNPIEGLRFFMVRYTERRHKSTLTFNWNRRMFDKKNFNKA
jgi:hypothetical protein